MATERKISLSFVIVALYALATSVVTVVVSVSYDMPTPYLWIEPPIGAATWLSVWAWTQGRWFIAAGGLLVSILAPWGYIYFGPLVAFGLTGVAVFRGARPRGGRLAHAPQE